MLVKQGSVPVVKLRSGALAPSFRACEHESNHEALIRGSSPAISGYRIDPAVDVRRHSKVRLHDTDPGGLAVLSNGHLQPMRPLRPVPHCDSC